MTAETQRPNGELSDVGLVTNDYTDHDEDPDVSSVTIAAVDNNTSTEYGVDFPTPTGPPTVGAGLQEFRAGVEEFDSGQTGTPQARIELWENGSLVRAGTDTNVSTYAVLSFTWNANELATADGSLVQMKVIGTKSGGSPGARNTVNIGHMEWNADYTVAAAFVEQDGFRFRDDDGSETTATWLAAENVDLSLEKEVAFRLRFVLSNTGTATENGTRYFWVSKNSGAYAKLVSSSEIDAALSDNFADVDPTTEQLASGQGTFTAGWMKETEGGQGLAISAGNFEEYEISLTSTASASVGDTYDFKMGDFDSENAFEAYNQIPRLTIVVAAAETWPGWMQSRGGWY